MTVRMFQIEYEYPGAGRSFSVGQIRESPEHLVVIWQWVEGWDIFNFVVIPKCLVKKVVEIEPK